jgi:hypothetical protein
MHGYAGGQEGRRAVGLTFWLCTGSSISKAAWMTAYSPILAMAAASGPAVHRRCSNMHDRGKLFAS